MKEQVIYISGPMTGIEGFNYAAFNAAAQTLRSIGYIVFNPAELFGGDSSLEKERYMTVDRAAIAACDALVVLPGWSESHGTKEEMDIALSRGISIYEYEYFLRRHQMEHGICV